MLAWRQQVVLHVAFLFLLSPSALLAVIGVCATVPCDQHPFALLVERNHPGSGRRPPPHSSRLSRSPGDVNIPETRDHAHMGRRPQCPQGRRQTATTWRAHPFDNAQGDRCQCSAPTADRRPTESIPANAHNVGLRPSRIGNASPYFATSKSLATLLDSLLGFGSGCVVCAGHDCRPACDSKQASKQASARAETRRRIQGAPCSLHKQYADATSSLGRIATSRLSPGLSRQYTRGKRLRLRWGIATTTFSWRRT